MKINIKNIKNFREPKEGSMELGGLYFNNFKTILDRLMPNWEEIDIDYTYGESEQVADIIDNQEMGLYEQLVAIGKILGLDKRDSDHTMNITLHLLGTFIRSGAKPNIEEYLESSIIQFKIFIKLAVAYREKYESARFQKTKSARGWVFTPSNPI